MKKLTVYEMATCAIMAALMCVLGPLSVPIGPVPVTLTNLVIYISIMILGWKLSTVSVVIYLLLGLVGLPVFSGFSGGVGKLAGPTGGYLIGFIFVVLVSGLFEKAGNKNWIKGVGMLVGTAVLYLFGTVWFVILMQCEIGYAMSVCVIPFIPFDLAKIVIGVFLGAVIKKALVKANLAV